jgi:putative membrane protein
VHEPVAQLQAAGDLMYFGGDVAELLLALALLSSWRPRRFRSAVIG